MGKYLDKLRKADPRLCAEIEKLLLPEDNENNIKINLYILCGELCGAIAAKGWTWNICSLVDLATFSAYISEIAPGYDGDHWSEQHEYCMCECEGDSPASALLEAYVLACEGQI
jgi:hypothetical protein